MGVRLEVVGDGAAEFIGEAVVFDLDGVLVDSSHLWPVAERLAIERLGGSWNADSSQVVVAGTAPDAAAVVLARKHGLVGRERDIQHEAEVAAAEVFRREVRQIAGARALLAALAEHCPVAIATNSPTEVARASMGAAGILGAVDVVVTADDVSHGKPHPELYLRAAQALGVAAEDCLAVDDTPTGMRAAVAAGMTVLGYGSLASAAREEIEGVSAAISAWSDVRVHGATPRTSGATPTTPLR